MTELGNRLKEAREAKGLSLDDLQEITKIQKRYLSGIEEGNYDMMPGKFYVRAFIKQYCEAVGLDSEEIFEQYQSNVPTSIHDEIPEQLSRVKSRKSMSPQKSKATEMLPKLLGVIVVVGIIAVIYVFVSNVMGNSKDSTKEEDKQSENVDFNESKEFSDKEAQVNETPKKNNEVDNTSAKEDVKKNQDLTVSNTSGNSSTYELKNTDEFKLKLVSTGEAWVGVTNTNGEYLYQGTLKQNQSEEIDLTDETSVFLNIGKATDIELYVNDEKLEYANSPTEVISQKITIQFTKAE